MILTAQLCFFTAFRPKQKIFTICTVIRAGWDLLGDTFGLSEPSLFTEVVVESQHVLGQKGSSPTPLPWAGTSLTRAGCSKPYPTRLPM